MVDAVILRGDEDMFEPADVGLHIGMFPELDEQPNRIGRAGLQRAEMEQLHRDDGLRNIVEEGVQEAGAETREPIHLLDGMMPRMGSPKHAIMMLRSMDPINDEVHDKDGRNNFRGAGQPLKKVNHAVQIRWRKVTNPTFDHVSANAIDEQRKSERQDIQAQVTPVIDLTCGPKVFTNSKYCHQPKKSGYLIISRLHS